MEGNFAVEDGPTGEMLVSDHYYKMAILAKELGCPDDVRDFGPAEWKDYATKLADHFRLFDLLLKAGAPLPKEWVRASEEVD